MLNCPLNAMSAFLMCHRENYPLSDASRRAAGVSNRSNISHNMQLVGKSDASLREFEAGKKADTAPLLRWNFVALCITKTDTFFQSR